MKRIYLILLVVAFMAGCSQREDKKAKLEKLRGEYSQLGAQIKKLEEEIAAEEGVSGKIKPVQVTAIETAVFSHYIEVQGKVDGDENIAVSPKMAGFVTSINVEVGQEVSKGQLLITLDAQVLYQTLAELEASLVFVTDIYNKQKSLWDQNIGSEVQYLTAKNNKESLENKIKTVKEQIAMTRITSPINGTVEDIPVKIGQVLAPGMPAIRVVNFNKMKVVADLAESYSPKVKTGDSVVIFFPDFNTELRTRLSFTSRYINPVNRTFMVESQIRPEEETYRANMIAVLKINDYSNAAAVIVPVNVIQRNMTQQFVFVAVSEKNQYVARKKIISTGQTYNGMTEVLSGIKPGDKLITSGFQDLTEGQLISF